MGIHYRYGGSTAKRTIRCTGWAALARKLEADIIAAGGVIVDKSSIHADRGSMLHLACETLERDNLEYQDLLDLGIQYNGFKLTPELIDTKVVPAMEALDDLVYKYGVKHVVTEEVIKVNDLVGGTIDIYAEAVKVLVFADFKFGEGIMVYAEKCAQLLFYAWAKMTTSKFPKPIDEYEKIILAIIQPADRREEPLDIWEVSVQDVFDFGHEFLKAVDLAEKTKAGDNLCTGDHCQFCPCAGLGDCPAKENENETNIEALKLLDSDYPNETSLKVLDKKDNLHTLKLSEALDIIEKLEPWIKQVRSFACKQLEVGAEVEDWKLVIKRPTKKWDDPLRMEKYLKRKLGAANAMESKLISPAKAVKAAKVAGVKLRLKGAINTDSSGTTLVRASDPREAVLSDYALGEQLKLLGGEDEKVIFNEELKLIKD